MSGQLEDYPEIPEKGESLALKKQYDALNLEGLRQLALQCQQSLGWHKVYLLLDETCD